MPTIDDLTEDPKFKKSTYRPWNYMDEIEKENLENNREFKDKTKSPSKKEIFFHGESDIKSISDKIFYLSGYQKTLFFFVLDRSMSRGLLSTGPVTSKTLVDSIRTTHKMVKTTIGRLVSKKLITRENGRSGRGGFYSFSVTEETRNAFLEYKRITFLSHASKNEHSNEHSHVDPDLESDSLKNDINISPLSNIGLTFSHMIQIKKDEKLTKQQIQDSIDYFAFDLKHNEKAKTLKKTPLDFFMGILRQGIPYAAPSNYESKESESMRLYLESKEKIEKTNKDLEEKFKKNILQEWIENLSPYELMEFYVESDSDPSLGSLSDKIQATFKKRNAIKNATEYFESQLWPIKRIEILSKKTDVETNIENG
jgi:predicted transcriptional regulator